MAKRRFIWIRRRYCKEVVRNLVAGSRWSAPCARRWWFPALGAACVVLLMPTRAWAIPTPDVMVSAAGGILQGLIVVAGFLAAAATACWRAIRSPDRGPRSVVIWGLLLLLGGSLAFNWFQHQSASSRDRVRLSRNLVRRSTQDGKTVKDDRLVVLSKSDQLESPWGLSTDEVAHIVAGPNRDRFLLLDIREDEEYAAARLRDVVHVRYPDVAEYLAKTHGVGRDVILLCYSGNRSGELASGFSEHSADAEHAANADAGEKFYFMIGGYEKWWSEGRPLQLADGTRHPRDIQYYPNRDTLLDTPEVEAAYAQDDVYFIDARYDKEFEATHLPGAIQITLRSLTSEAIEASLSDVPDGARLIGLGYDKRSSFYSMILGAKLTERGHQWLGRYTVPHEFMAPKRKSQDPERRLLSGVTRWAGLVLARLTEVTGNIGVAILLLVLMLRVVVLPITWMAERSDAASRRIHGRLLRIKRRHRGNRRRIRIARERLQRKAGVRPIWGFIASVLQIGIFVGLAGVLASYAALEGASFVPGWIDDLQAPDPIGILPALIAALLGTQMFLSGRVSDVPRRMGVVLLCLGFLLLTLPLMAALNLAIVANLACSVTQRTVYYLGAAIRRRPRRKRVPEPLVSLAACHHYLGIGSKADRLSQLMDAGLPVSDGFVLTETFLEGLFDCRSDEQTRDRAFQRVRRAFDRLGVEEVAVRSSAVGEDGPEHSYAGMFDTRLHVTRDQLYGAVEHVYRSFRSLRSRSYGDGKKARPCVLIQAMIHPDCAGVLFTRHPRQPLEMAVEYVQGLADTLVSGDVDPVRFTLGRQTGQPIENVEGARPVPHGDLYDLACRCEALFGRPQDIEWAAVDGKVYLVQCRDITMVDECDVIQRERSRLRDLMQESSSRLCRDGYAELNPRPTLASLSLLRRLVGENGAVHQVREFFGVPYDPSGASDILVTVFGRLFVNPQRLAVMFPKQTRVARLKCRVATSRILSQKWRITAAWERVELPRMEREVRMERSRDLSSLDGNDLAWLLEKRVDRFVGEHYVAAEKVNLIAATLEAQLRRRLSKAGLTLDEINAYATPTITYQGADRLRQVACGKASLDEYLAEYGHRAPVDYELSSPRFAEDANMIRDLLRAASDSPCHVPPDGPQTPNLSQMNGRRRERVDREMRLLAELTAMKEAARHHVLKSLELIRHVLMEIGDRTGIGECVFSLTLTEAGRLAQGDDVGQLKSAAKRRRLEREQLLAFDAIEGHSNLDIATLERLGRVDVQVGDGELVGTCASGSKEVVGTARIIRVGERLPRMNAGEILVSTYTDTSLAPLFRRAGGLVTEVGGMLSHAAIVAREFGLTAIVGVQEVTRRVKTGDVVRLSPDGKVHIIESPHTTRPSSPHLDAAPGQSYPTRDSAP